MNNTEIQTVDIRVIHLALSISDISMAASWGVKFAIDHPHCIGKTMRQVACEIGFVSIASISKHAVMFCEQAGLPPSKYMKSEKARESARISRNKSTQKI